MDAPVRVDYENVKQEGESWCWGAVAANVYNSLLPAAEAFYPAGRKLHQCDVAQKVNQVCEPKTPFSLVVALESWKPPGQPVRGLGVFETQFNPAAPNIFQNISDE